MSFRSRQIDFRPKDVFKFQKRALKMVVSVSSPVRAPTSTNKLVKTFKTNELIISIEKQGRKYEPPETKVAKEI
jgi:hypothetical protein